ncbi:MAG: ABC transporter substrate-binding protein, partial [Deltaproteobacteria bacterium]
MTAPVVQGKIKEGGSWTTAATATLKLNDAHTVTGNSVWNYVSERMLEPDPLTAAIRPNVLTSWEVADPAGTTLVFKVHPKLFVHDMPPYNGRQFTAEDVAWNLMRIGGLMAKGGPLEEKGAVPLAQFQRASMVANITKAEAVDPLTVKVTLSRPNNAFFNGLTENRVPFMPKESADVGFGDQMKLAGIGP